MTKRRLGTDQVLVATHNTGKLREISALLGPYGISTVSCGEMGLPEPVEDGTTFEQNARIKARAGVQASGLVTLADDSGIEVDALDGAPGVYTANWAETADGRDFVMAMTKTRDLLAAKDAPMPWTARFCCTLVVAWPDGTDTVFAGVMPGQVVWPMRGELGHGYDPCFQPDGYDITFGEMQADEKNRISHRADAFRKLVAGLLD